MGPPLLCAPHATSLTLTPAQVPGIYIACFATSRTLTGRRSTLRHRASDLAPELPCSQRTLFDLRSLLCAGVCSFAVAAFLAVKSLYARRVVARLTAASSVAGVAAGAVGSTASSFRRLLLYEYVAQVVVTLCLFVHLVYDDKQCGVAGSSGPTTVACVRKFFKSVYVSGAVRVLRLQIPTRLVVVPEALRGMAVLLVAIVLVATRQPEAFTLRLMLEFIAYATVTALVVPFIVALNHNRVIHARHCPPDVAWPAALCKYAAAMAAAAERFATALLPEPALDAGAPAGIIVAYTGLNIIAGTVWQPLVEHTMRINIMVLFAGLASAMHKRRSGTASGLALLQQRMGRHTVPRFDNDASAPDAGDAAAELALRLKRVSSEQETVRATLEALHVLFPKACACAVSTVPLDDTDLDAENFLEVAAEDEGLRRALLTALQAAPERSAARAVCTPGGPAIASSDDWDGGVTAFEDWAMVMRKGHNVRQWVTVRLPAAGFRASSAAVGFVVLAFDVAHSFGASDAAAHEALFGFAVAAGAALVGRRTADAFADQTHKLNRAAELASAMYPKHILVALGVRRISSSGPAAAAAAAAEEVADAEAAAEWADVNSALGAFGEEDDDADLLMAQHEAVTVVVADVVGFSALCQSITPEASIRLLHRLWQRFDALSMSHGLYKVDTVGDSYIAVAGMVPPRPDHARAAVRFALDLHAAAASVTVHSGAKQWTLTIRVGLHTGPVSSGVLGRLRPRFCIFGDTCTEARRAEAGAPAGSIQLSLSTRDSAALPLGVLPERLLDGGQTTMLVLQAGSPEAAAVRAILDAPPTTTTTTARTSLASTREDEEPLMPDDEGGPVHEVAAPSRSSFDASRRGSLDLMGRRGSMDGPRKSVRMSRMSRAISPPRASFAMLRRAAGIGATGSDDADAQDTKLQQRCTTFRYMGASMLAGSVAPTVYLMLIAWETGRPLLGVADFSLFVAAVWPLLRPNVPPGPAALQVSLWSFGVQLNMAIYAVLIFCGEEASEKRAVFRETCLFPFASLPWIIAAVPIRLIVAPDVVLAAMAYANLFLATPAAERTALHLLVLAAEVTFCTIFKLMLLPLLYIPASGVLELLADVDTAPPWRALRNVRDWAINKSLHLRRVSFNAPLLDGHGTATLTVHLFFIVARMSTVTDGFRGASLLSAIAGLRSTLALVCIGSAAMKLRAATLVVPREPDAAAEARVLTTLRERLSSARSEAAVLAAAAAAMEELFTGAVAGGVGSFAEGTSYALIAALEVFAPTEPSRAALTAALPPSTGAHRTSSVSRACRNASGRVPLLDSRNVPGGLAAFVDWAAAAEAGLPTARAITAPLTAGPVVVGFAQLHLGLYGQHAGRDISAALLRLCDLVGGAIFVRRAFAVSASGATAGTGAGNALAGHAPRRMSSITRVNVTFSEDSVTEEAATPRAASPELSAPYPATPADVAALAALDERAAEDLHVLRSWALDAWELSEMEVQRLALAMLNEAGLLRAFSLSPTAVAAFISDVSAHMNDNPFHNFRHVFSVMHIAWLFLEEEPELRRRGLLQDLDCLSLLLSALCHDLEHPGTTNAFQVNTGSALAIRYNDASVLENHHASVAAGVLSRARVLAPLRPADVKRVRRSMLTAILATDMSTHKSLLAAVKARLDGTGGSDAPGFDPDHEEDRQLLVSFLLHCADLCNPLLPPPVSRRIAGDLSREFAAQAQRERAAGMPVTVMLADDDLGKAKLESGFLDYGPCPLLTHAHLASQLLTIRSPFCAVVLPLYATLARACPQLGRRCLPLIETNRAAWGAVVAAADLMDGL